jgi:hypothetical protein
MLIGAPPQDSDAAAAKREQEEGAAEARRGAVEARKGRIDSMRGAADAFRSSAEELESQTNDPGQTPSIREALVSNARNLRARAATIDEQVKKLTGG